MKQELIALSPAGIISVFFAGMILGSIDAGRPFAMNFILAITMLAYTWQDAREPWQSGIWKRGWFRWTRTGSAP